MFNSVGKVVNIGVLSTIIQGLITVKSFIFSDIINVTNDISEYDDEQPELLEILGSLDFLEQLSKTSKSISLQDSNLKDIYIIYCISIKKALFGPFLFCQDCAFTRSKHLSFYSISNIFHYLK